MEPELIIANNIAQTRNLFLTEFTTKKIDQECITRVLKYKLMADYQQLVKKVVKDESKKDVKHGQIELTSTIINKTDIEQHNIDNTSTNQPHIDNLDGQTNKGLFNVVSTSSQTTLLNTLLTQLTQTTNPNQISTFSTFQQNTKDTNQPLLTDRQLVVSKTISMNLAQSTRLGTLRASSLRRLIKPQWHPPFKLYRVIVGHQGWVRGIAVSPCNTFFATGSADRTIKFWDLASGQLKVTLTGHINTVRAVQFSKNHPYLFSCGEDKSVKCWDLQMNKVIRNYHGHLSGVYCLKLHDSLGILATGGRDSAARIWDIRVRRQIHALVGHSHTVGSILTQQSQPHVVTGSHDSFIKLWDIGQGKCINTLTNHKKSIRAMVQHPKEYTFASAASDNIKVWKSPQGEFLRNIAGHHSIIDTMATNIDGVLVSGGDDGTMKFWDWKSGYNYQQIIGQPQPGSIAAQNGIFALSFDRSGSRLISGQCDKTIKMWKEDDTATEQTHPIKQYKMEFDRT